MKTPSDGFKHGMALSVQSPASCPHTTDAWLGTFLSMTSWALVLLAASTPQSRVLVQDPCHTHQHRHAETERMDDVLRVVQLRRQRTRGRPRIVEQVQVRPLGVPVHNELSPQRPAAERGQCGERAQQQDVSCWAKCTARGR